MKKVVIGLSALLLFLTGCKIVINPDENVSVNKTPAPIDLDTNNNNMSDAVVKNGDKVKVDYAGWKEDGTYFDTSIESIAKEQNIYDPRRPYEPLEFVVGAGQMIKGFDLGVVGMKIGEKKTIKIQPEDAYGERVPEMITAVAAGEGKYLYNQFVKVELITGDQAKLDFNMPLAGKEIIFEVLIKNNVTKPGQVAGTGDVLSIDYTIYYDDGKVFDSNVEELAKKADSYDPERIYEAIDYVVGQGLPGVDKAILGMKEGTKQSFNIAPKDSFGEYDYSKIGLYKKGDKIDLFAYSPTLQDVTSTGITIDFNHSLAGEVLNFEITLIDIVTE